MKEFEDLFPIIEEDEKELYQKAKLLFGWPEVKAASFSGGNWGLICGESIIADAMDETGATSIAALIYFMQKYANAKSI